MRKIKSGVTTAIALSGSWLFGQILILIILNVQRSSYFAFGPSPLLNMPFTSDLAIDTWTKWSFLVFLSMVSSVVSVYNSAMLQPWIESVALNPEIKLPHDKFQTLIMVNLSWSIQMGTSAITFVYTSTQVDIAIFSAISAMLVYYVCSWQIINDTDRDRLDSNDNTENIFQLDDLPSAEADDEEDGLLLSPKQLRDVIETHTFV